MVGGSDMTTIMVVISFVFGIWVGFAWSAIELRKSETRYRELYGRANQLVDTVSKHLRLPR